MYSDFGPLSCNLTCRYTITSEKMLPVSSLVTYNSCPTQSMKTCFSETVHSFIFPFSVLNFIVSICRPNFVEVFRTAESLAVLLCGCDLLDSPAVDVTADNDTKVDRK
jgi:hypothetical protein